MILTAIVLLIAFSSIARATGSPDKNGKYKIQVSLPERFQSVTQDNNGKLYLSKYIWGGNKTVIDSVSVEDNSATFIGKIYPIELDGKRCDSLFTAGEYEISIGKDIKLLDFFYSYTSRGSLDCIFKTNEVAENVFQSEYLTTNKALKKRFGKENKLYLKLQNFNNLRKRIISGDSTVIAHASIHNEFDDNMRSLVPSIRHEASKDLQGSLLETFINFYNSPNHKSEISETELFSPALFTDDRLFFTSFGEEILLRLLERIEYNRTDSVCKSVDKILNNKFITSERMKGEMSWSAFRYFSKSKVMNSANVAVHIAENYILNNKPLVSEEKYFEASYFTTLNKGTLIGEKAPDLALKDTSGNVRPLSDLKGEYTIIYFYSDDCAYCKLETPKLAEFFESYNHTPLNVYAVYTGTDEKAWKDYIKKNFYTINLFINRIDVADINRESRFALSYGVASTPTELLLNNEHRVIGRRLRVENIREILENEHSRHLALFRYFTMAFPEDPQSALSEEERKNGIDRLYTLATEKGKFDLGENDDKRGDFCDMFREMYYYLSSSEQYDNQLAALYLAEKYIIGKENLWEDTNFTARVRNAVKSFRMNMLGTQADDATLYDISGSPANLLDGRGRYKILFFYSVSCSICVEYADELQFVYNKFYSKVPISMTGIYTLDDYSSWKNFIAKKGFEWRNLWDKDKTLGEKYDISNVPSIYLLDQDNTIIAKDIEPKDLDGILEIINKSSL